MARLRIVLVEPREAGNVGAVARVMKNFGFDDLWIVGEHPELLPVAGWWASGADDLLARAQFVPTLQGAVADVQMTVATTSMRGRTSPVSFTARTLAARFAELGDRQTLALVLGREDSGLTREELALCQYTAAIPTGERFPTMNLAQATCVFAYELSSVVPSTVARPATERDLADAGSIERMHQLARDLLIEAGFLNESNPDSIYEELRAMAGRAALDARDVTILMGVIRQVRWKLQHPANESRSDTP